MTVMTVLEGTSNGFTPDGYEFGVKADGSYQRSGVHPAEWHCRGTYGRLDMTLSQGFGTVQNFRLELAPYDGRRALDFSPAERLRLCCDVECHPVDDDNYEWTLTVGKFFSK